MNIYKGSCLCGSIAYEVKELGSKMAHCHCSMCRKFHGSAFATFGEAKVENFQWIKGESQLRVFTASNGTQRKFCVDCGSSLVFVPSNDTGEVVEFALGTLDTSIDQRPDAHIFVDSKSSWFEIDDELPQYDCGRN